MKKKEDKVIKKKTTKKEVKEKKIITFNLVELIVIIIITALIVAVGSGYLIYTNYDKINNEIGKKETKTTDLDEFYEAYNKIVNGYVEEVDKGKLLEAAIAGMYAYLQDVYSDYLTQEEAQNLKERLQGQYEGIGVEITSGEEYVKVTDVFEGSPAYKAGIQKGDYIISVNGEDMKGKTTSYVASSIKNKTSVSLTYKRNDKETTIKLNITPVTIDSIKYEVYDKVGYIKISTFASNTFEQFNKALKELKNKNITGLVIDVRDNSGGYLTSAQNICEVFLSKGKVMYQLQNKEGKISEYKAVDNDSLDYKVAVIINGETASASEILAAALKESYGATLVGITSYGKGSVQEAETLSSGSMVKYTTSYWLTPKGNVVNKVGIKPDIQVLEDDSDKDETLEAAIKAVK